jgi:hypothetical protein
MDSVERFANLFHGCESAFGTYDTNNSEVDDRGKLKGSAKTVRETLTLEHWRAHLEGRSAIGIIPIDEHNQVRFGAVDVDSYNLNHTDAARRIARMGLPLIVARSKSGGMHLFLFAAEPIPAGTMIARLKAIAALLGYAGAETFPKQHTVNWDKGDLGSWINLPYFSGLRAARYAINPEDGEPLATVDFLNRAETLRQPASWFSAPLTTTTMGDELPGAPPCLQTLVQIGIRPGQRNNTLLAFGVYCKRARPDTWQTELEQINQRYFAPPLGSDEAATLIRSLRKKDYCYSCKTQPLASHCNRTACVGREYGIGQGSAVVLTHIRILETDPPLYFVSVESAPEPLELDVETLYDHAKFQKACIARLRIYPPPKKKPEWAAEVDALLRRADTIPAPPDASDAGRVKFLIEKFLTGRSCAQTRDEILLGKPWHDNGRTYFRAPDLQTHLKRNTLQLEGPKLWNMLRKLGAQSHEGWKLKGVSTNLWSLPSPEAQSKPFDLPEGMEPDAAF